MRRSDSRLLAWLPDNRFGEAAGRAACRLGRHSVWCRGWRGCRESPHRTRRPVRAGPAYWTTTPIEQGTMADLLPPHPVFVQPQGDPRRVLDYFTDHVISELVRQQMIPPHRVAPRYRLTVAPSIAVGAAAAVLFIAALVLAVTTYT